MTALFSLANGTFVPVTPPYDVPPAATPTLITTGLSADSSDAAKKEV